MSLISKQDRDKLFQFVKHELGYPLRPFEIKEEMMLSYLEMVIEDYSSYMNEWLTRNQWINLEGQDRENTDFIYAFTTKTNDYMNSFTYSYSKQIGMGTNAPAAKGWELKRDYITVVADTQHYIIPKGREVNDLLWETPPQIGTGFVDPFATSALSPGTFGWSYFGRPAMYMQPTYSTLLAAQDFRMKQRVMQSLLTYKITGLETGEKVLHLYPIPGSRNEIGTAWVKHFEGSKVWYWYYDVNKGGKKRCQKDNPDVVVLPSDPILEVLKWDKLNSVAKQMIRDLLIAKVKITIGGIRGFYTGDVSASEKVLTMDYRHLLDEGKELKEATLTRLTEMLDKLNQVNLTGERATIAQNLNNNLQFQPFKKPITHF